MRLLMLGQIIQSILTGSPVFFLFLAVTELQRPAPRGGRLVAICLGMLALTAANVWVSIKVQTGTFIETYQMCARARLRLADHLRRLSLGFFKRRDPGEISALMLQDMATVEQAFSHLIGEAVAMAVIPALLAIGLMTQDLRLAMCMLAAACLAAPALAAGQRLVGRFGGRQTASRVRAASRILEYVQGMGVLKAFNMTGRGFRRLDEALTALKRDSVWLEAAAAIPIAVFGMILDVGLAAFLVYATSLVSRELVAPSIFVMFVVLGAKFYEPIQNFGLFFTELRYMRIAAARIAKAMDEKPLPVMPAASPGASIPKGHAIEFEGVSFAYPGGPDVLSGLSLSIPERSLTALVGRSGGGKTTMANLMARFWDQGEGRITIGGVDVRSFPQDSLNALFAFVFQDVYLFEDSIWENIRVGDRAAPESEILRAAKAARCLEFVERMPEGWKTRVGEGGAALSGGERQRISIARAILKDAPIIVLDEATASLDPENELSVQRAIAELIREKTVVVIAHRLRTVMAADQLAVIDGGAVAELGTHEDLLAKGGIYASLWSEQLRTGGWRLPKRMGAGRGPLAEIEGQ